MTIYQFTQLDQNEKANAVLGSVFLAERKEKDVIFHLYYLAHFYVEIWYYNDPAIIYGMKPFSTPRSLEPYLNSISITGTGLLKA